MHPRQLPHALPAVVAAALCALTVACSSAPPESKPAESKPEPGGLAVSRQVLITGLTDPWDVAFLPDGSMLYTESSGRIGIYDPSAATHQTILQPPSDLFYDAFQSGMLGLAVDPKFDENRYVYTYFTSRAGSDANAPRELPAAETIVGSTTVKGPSGTFRPTDPGCALAGPSLPEGTTVQKFLDSTMVQVSHQAQRSSAGPLRLDHLENRVVRWTLANDQRSLRRDADIVTGIPYGWHIGSGHSGGRIRFGPDGYLYITAGDGDSGLADQGHAAQNGQSLGGKVLRVDRQGKAAAGNPRLAGFDARIFTYGHRNPQGLAFRPRDGLAYSVEHGPLRDDEVNLLTPGANFGWDPLFFGPGRARLKDPPMTDLEKFPEARPAVWSSGAPAVAPSGATFISNRGTVDWKDWDGALAIALLKGRSLLLLFLDDADRVQKSVTVLADQKTRLRSVAEGPDGALYITTDAYEGTLEEAAAEGGAKRPGEIWRLTPR